MSEKSKKIIHTVISVTVSLALVVVGALFIAQCIGIYNSGERPFTRESVGAALKKILIPTLVFAVVTLIGALVSFILPLKEKKKAEKNPRFTQIRLAQLCDERRLNTNELSDVHRERTVRCFVYGGGIILFIVSLVYPAFYVFSPERFGYAGPDAINSEFIRAVSVLLLCLTPFAIYFLFGIFACRKSYQREIEVLKNGNARISKENLAMASKNEEITPISLSVNASKTNATAAVWSGIGCSITFSIPFALCVSLEPSIPILSHVPFAITPSVSISIS